MCILTKTETVLFSEYYFLKNSNALHPPFGKNENTHKKLKNHFFPMHSKNYGAMFENIIL